MAGFQYEKNLPHQEMAVNAVLSVFENIGTEKSENYVNPTIHLWHKLHQKNIIEIQHKNGIEITKTSQHQPLVLDISMETGTGKTYTYTKTLYELHRTMGLFKFIIAVPTVSIKAGTKNFLKSEALKQHFRLDFNGNYNDTEIQLYVVESKENSKSRSAMPEEIVRFVAADNCNKIHVLLINAGMINSKTMAGENKGNDGSRLIQDLYAKPFEAIVATKPVMIIDEPHKFAKENTTWKNLLKFQPQFIVRYGATFKEFHYLLYRLTALDAFNQDLVKGVQVFIEQIQGVEKTQIELLETDGNEATFELQNGKQKSRFKLTKGESLRQIHAAIEHLFIEALNKKTVVLSNGLELTKGSQINPFSYFETLTEKMMRNAIHEHFRLERNLFLRREGRIKPLTLFFIDDIQGYRDKNNLAGSSKNNFEAFVKAEVENLLKTETNTTYRNHLQHLLENISQSHGGYFSQDNSSNDEKIEKEVQEILHDKEALLQFDNPRRFIFSKWTLREGWDNPNVFQICKLRSSGSETNKLQEVGRGLRLPVNEYMGRVKDGNFKLNYFVDGSEQDFVEKLVGEVNKSLLMEEKYTELTTDLVEKILKFYPNENKRHISNQLYENHLIDNNEKFICTNPATELKKLFPLVFAENGLKQDKIFVAGKSRNKVPMRIEHYQYLKDLWDKINEKALLRYEIKSEKAFEDLFVDYLQTHAKDFTESGLQTKIIEIRENQGNGIYGTEIEKLNEIRFAPLKTMNYADFIHKLAQSAFIQRRTLINAFNRVKYQFNIENFLNEKTIVQIKQGFNDYLLYHSFNSFEVGYQRVGSAVHPTKFTDETGEPLAEVNASDLGVHQNDQKSPLENYLFNTVFFDSDLELKNITQGNIREVLVFTKIPKNSIKIPVAGGQTYSPDFAYIVKTDKGDILNLILESKNTTDSNELRNAEKQKILHAEKMFASLSDLVNVKFRTQFEGQEVAAIIKDCLKSINY